MINAFDEMSGKEKELYKEMWSDFDFSKIGAKIKNTKGSKKSYCFDGNQDKEQLLIKTFNIKNRDLFSKKYGMAISGSGEEEKKITILRSSSLCALLHFYNVTDDNPLTLEFVTDKSKRKVEFTESFFEYKSPVIRKPSNMDVVLFGEDKENNKNIILFLESKFSEYYIDATNEMKGISRQYLKEDRVSAKIYDSTLLEKIGLRIKPENEKYFTLETLDEKQIYIQGIKQMISHYVGVSNVVNGKLYGGKESDKQNNLKKAIRNKEAIIILGEIVFDRIIENLEGNNYGKAYHELALGIAEQIKDNNRFEIITDELKYSLFADNDYEIEPNIKAFYKYKMKK